MPGCSTLAALRKSCHDMPGQEPVSGGKRRLSTLPTGLGQCLCSLSQNSFSSCQRCRTGFAQAISDMHLTAALLVPHGVDVGCLVTTAWMGREPIMAGHAVG